VKLNQGSKFVIALDQQSGMRPIEHEAILLCFAGRLLQFRKPLYDSSERYRRMEAVLIRDRCPDDEHRQIAEAAIERNIPLATRLLKLHIERTTENIVQATEKQVDQNLRAAKAQPPGLRNRVRSRIKPSTRIANSTR
jgi:hypothetical protein